MKKKTPSAKAAFLAETLKKGEHYAGILLGKNGEPDQHIILLPGQAAGLTFQQAQEFAAKAGGELPTRREQALLFANLKEEFEASWYWSGEQPADTRFAWFQSFGIGVQNDYCTYDTCRARAVRRITIE